MLIIGFQELLKLWIHHQYLDDKDEERFLESIWAVAKVSRSTEQIGVLIDGVRKEVYIHAHCLDLDSKMQ